MESYQQSIKRNKIRIPHIKLRWKNNLNNSNKKSDWLPGQVFFKGTSNEAKYIRKNCTWESNPLSHIPAIAENIKLDVLVITKPIPVPKNLDTTIHSKKYTAEYMSSKMPVVIDSILVVSKVPKSDSFQILSCFITDKDIKNIGLHLNGMYDTVLNTSEWFPYKQGQYWSVGDTVKRIKNTIGPSKTKQYTDECKNSKSWKEYSIFHHPKVKKYRQGCCGIQYNEGILCSTSKHEWAKKKRGIPEDISEPFINLVSSMHFVEDQISPQASAYRQAFLRERYNVPIFKNIPLKLSSATQVGFSLGFACNAHNDSSKHGIPETIFWEWPDDIEKGSPYTYSFINYEAGVIFGISANHFSILLQKGNCFHGTLPSNNDHQKCKRYKLYHNGCGAVLVSKKKYKKN